MEDSAKEDAVAQRHKEIVSSVCAILKRRLAPDRIILFGSRAKGSASRHADFDFAVDTVKPNFSLARQVNDEIEGVSGLYKVDIVYLRSVDNEFRDLVLSTGKILYAKINLREVFDRVKSTYLPLVGSIVKQLKTLL